MERSRYISEERAKSTRRTFPKARRQGARRLPFPLTREDREAIDFICGYIASNLGGDLSCSRLANQLYIGKTKLKNLFKTATGLSPSHYVAHERMEEAARLLAETDLAIAEIGEKVGYTKPGAFTEAFRRDRGCTPTQFRKQR